MGKPFALYLKLSIQCHILVTVSAAMILVDSSKLKHIAAVTEGYTDEYLKNKFKMIANKIMSINKSASLPLTSRQPLITKKMTKLTHEKISPNL